MRRYLPRLVLTGALLSPMSVWALGLGEIRLNSSLNQPFDAEIELISPTAEELQSLKVGLAGNDVFARLNIDRPSYLSGFDFSITRTRDGGAAIRVRSSRSVTEPFVTLLVEASWARGRLVREYTVLLDPPVFAPSQGAPAAPLATPQSGARSEGVVERPATQPAPAPQEPVATPAPTPPPAAPAPRAAPSVAGDYTVQRNDTLWRIASRVNPGSPAVVNQTMIALYRANPQAFDGNINRLRAGSVLRIPDLAEIEAISTREAAAEVARQTSEWTGALQADSTADVSRLRLVTPQEDLTPSTTTSPAETPASAQQGSSAAPAGGAGGQDRRLQVDNEALAGVQQSTDPALGTESPVTEEPSVAAETEAPAETEPAARTKPVQKPRTAPAADTSSEPSLLDRVREFWWVAVILGLLGLLLMFLRRRRTDTSEFDTPEPSDSAAFDYEPPARRAPAVAPAQEEPFLSAAEADDDFDTAAPQPAVRDEAPQTRPIEPVAAFQERSIDDTLSSDTAIRLDQQDALAEADFHMAYGLYDQAADLVKIAISRDPERRDLKLKLLEIYFVWGNKDLFLETARELHATRDAAAPGEWDKILIMGKQIAPTDALFEGETASLSDLVDVNLEGGENRVDVDLFAEPEPDQGAGLDLDLAATGEHLAATPSTDGELDFLLDETQHADAIEATREFDPLARTQETPTIESPMLDRSDSTIREKADTSAFASLSADQTAEISLDDLGLDTEALDHSGALEETTSLEKDGEGDTIESARPLRDDEMTQLAPSLGSADRTMMAPRAEQFDPESTGTIYLDEAELTGPAEAAGVGDTVEQPRATDIDSTAAMKLPDDMDFDVSALDAAASEDSDGTRADNEHDFSNAVFGDRTSDTAIIDLDVGDAFTADDASPTNKQVMTTEMELSELEPVTMSEVGTKLDLARAYMDMGDPDGARSILEEVLQEGNPNQKQEANRLLESIR
jgi:pilus assembly protein FimV